MRKFLSLLAVVVLFSASVCAEETETFYYEMSDADQTLTMTFVGDCTLGSDTKYRERDTYFESYITANGYGYPFANVKALFEEDDLTVANLECVLYDEEKYAAKKTYHFRAPTDYVNILTQSSIEAVTLGNNHIVDYGEAGALSTLDTLDAAGVAAFGSSDYFNRVWVFEKNGLRVGFVGVYISYWWQNADAVKKAFADVKAMDCDMVIAVMHGGVEYDTIQDANQERMVQRFIDMGADLVVGHHPHVVQGIENRDGRLVIYSLGNFCFAGNINIKAIDTYIARVTLCFKEGKYIGCQLYVIPAAISGTEGKSNFQPLTVTKDYVVKRILTQIRRGTHGIKFNTEFDGTGALQPFVAFPQTRVVEEAAQE